VKNKISFFNHSTVEHKNIKVRFHLGRGANFMNWQVKIGDMVMYYDPKDVTIIMGDAVLMNQRNVAQRIHDGDNKTVCAWICCHNILISPANENDNTYGEEIMFNPRIFPYWINGSKKNVDKQKYKQLITDGKRIFVVN
jgi:hypothetical protein